MRSRTDTAVPARERLLRSVALAALLGMAARFLSTPTSVPRVLRTSTATMHEALVSATRTAVPAIDVGVTHAAGPVERDWLRALDRAGSPVRWSPSAALGSLAVAAERIVVPGGVLAATLLAPAGATAILADDEGVIDSLATSGSGSLTVVARVDGMLRLRSGALEAAVARRDSVPIRPVLVIGQAAWETKYVVAALEEAGWPVATRMRVAPDVSVSQGGSIPLDTSRVAAVVLLDSAGTSAAGLARFVRSGGGAVLAMGAAAAPALASQAGVSPARRVRGELGALASSDPERGLAALTFTLRDRRGTVMARRDGAPIAVASRFGAGRVLALGVEETWRWRMQGSDGSVEAHRDWWSRAVASVAYAPLPGGSDDRGLDAAPVAAMYATLGPPHPISRDTFAVPPLLADALLLAVAFLSLLGEWASRRLRGAR